MMHKGLCTELSILGECTIVIEVVCGVNMHGDPKGGSWVVFSIGLYFVTSRQGV